MSERHTEALAHLNYGLHDGGGFVLLTGEVGTGKTTVSRCLRQQLPADSDLALVINPTLTERELLASICDEFQLDYAADAGIKELFYLICDFLVANYHAGRKTLLLIDEVDSFLQDRRGAQRIWEVTRVNEMLTQMEGFAGVFMASTNLMGGLDPAALEALAGLAQRRQWQPAPRHAGDRRLASHPSCEEKAARRGWTARR